MARKTLGSGAGPPDPPTVATLADYLPRKLTERFFEVLKTVRDRLDSVTMEKELEREPKNHRRHAEHVKSLESLIATIEHGLPRSLFDSNPSPSWHRLGESARAAEKGLKLALKPLMRLGPKSPKKRYLAVYQQVAEDLRPLAREYKEAVDVFLSHVLRGPLTS